jgi:hypothetical protein
MVRKGFVDGTQGKVKAKPRTAATGGTPAPQASSTAVAATSKPKKVIGQKRRAMKAPTMPAMDTMNDMAEQYPNRQPNAIPPGPTMQQRGNIESVAAVGTQAPQLGPVQAPQQQARIGTPPQPPMGPIERGPVAAPNIQHTGNTAMGQQTYDVNPAQLAQSMTQLYEQTGNVIYLQAKQNLIQQMLGNAYQEDPITKAMGLGGLGGFSEGGVIMSDRDIWADALDSSRPVASAEGRTIMTTEKMTQGPAPKEKVKSKKKTAK